MHKVIVVFVSSEKNWKMLFAFGSGYNNVKEMYFPIFSRVARDTHDTFLNKDIERVTISHCVTKIMLFTSILIYVHIPVE